jgi:RecB family exonuclease
VAEFEQLVAAVEAAKAHDPLAPVTVVVPSNYAGLSLRRRLARQLGGVVNVQFLTIERLAELLGAPALAAAGAKPLTKAVRTEALRAALSHEPGAFAPISAHPATLDSLDATFADLRQASDGALESIAAMSGRAADVVRLYRATRARVAGRYYDPHDLALAAAEAAPTNGFGAVVVYMPRRLAPSMRQMVHRLGVAVIDRAVDATPQVDRVISAEDPDEEVRAAVRLVMARARAGTALHRMAIVWPSDQQYAVLVHQQLDAAGIRHNGPATRTLAHTVAGTALLQLLALPDRDYRRDDVIAWLASAPVLERAGGRDGVPASQWDVVSAAAGVIGGADQWQSRLIAYGAEQAERKNVLELEDEVEPWRLERIDLNVERAARLRVFMAELVGTLERATGEHTWAALSEWACSLFDRYLGTEDRHYRWPDGEQDAWRRIRGAVEQLSVLDDMGTRVDRARFRQAVSAELAAPAARHGQFGTGVFTSHLRAALGTEFDVVVALGLAEGTLPGRRREDALLPDAERAATAGEVRPRGDAQQDELHDFRSALAASRGERVLTWPRTDPRRRRARLRSRWVPPDAAEDVIESFQQGLGGAPAATLTDYDLRDLLEWVERGGEPLDHTLAAELPAFGAGLLAAAFRAGSEFTRFAGNVGPGCVDPLDGTAPLSPTSLEQYAVCPARYFYAKVLHLNAPERPEEIRRIAPITKGSLVHEVLERFVRDVLEDPTARNEAHLLELAEAAFDDYHAKGVTGAPLLWRYERELMRRELLRFFAEDDDGSEPLAAELGFGYDGEVPVVLTLPNGRQIGFRGTADRVDRMPDGTLRVTDYKTGGDAKYRALATDPVGRGRLLQLPLYGLAARERFGDEHTPVTSRYWMVAEKADFREHPVPVDDDTIETLRKVLGVLVDGITGGRFPARPGEENWRGGWEECRYCDFDRVCQADRDRAWERVRTTPELEAYVELAEASTD